ncbi:MAG: sigma-54-dependent Fis family transcriptional regulator [Myxococcales bacterium]|nr:sigma-54-dependent Fis family transcriptional regulator [Myxococcales bacterium]MCB9715879.1 sigma-54-dependent Fis family transcriptional regulator [Myxococcales bacterium]
MSPPVILVVDDEPHVRFTLRAILEDEGLEVLEAEDGQQALEGLDARPVDLLVTDLSMPRLDGMGLLRALRERDASPPAIMITAHGSERTAVDAMKLGAIDYLPKPFDADEVARVIHRSLGTARLEQENRRLRAGLQLGQTMVFASEPMQRVAELVERVAGKDVTVLVTGESGTGKELVARALVRGSRRATAPYLRFNCAAITAELAEAELFGHAKGSFTGATRSRPGLFREADGGTLLLDEIGELSPAMQASLLRVLQEGEVRPVGEEHTVDVDVRLVAATNRDLRHEVTEGRFREDLFYRINVVRIHVPPLRERPADILPLAEHFAAKYAERFGVGEVRLSQRVRDQLVANPWPGNVRELEHAVERMVALATGPVIDELEDGPVPARSGDEAGGLKERLAAFERTILEEELAACDGNHSELARRLDLSRATLLDKLKRYGLR